MAQKQALLVVNPRSGTRSKSGLEKLVGERLAPCGIAVEAVSTQRPGHAVELAAQAVASGFDMVISAGGDGTVNEIASVLAHTSVALGILPLGSGNGLARSLGIPQDVGEALRIIGQGHVIRSDRGIVNGKPFYCTFGVGFDAAVSEKFATEKRRGRITYVRNVINEFLKYRSQPYAISIDGKVVTEKAFLLDFRTGLLNHEAAKEQISKLLVGGRNRQYALVFFDLDNFKQANDVHGHLFGDEVLEYVASTIKKNTRSSDIAARMGGDEFIIFMGYKGTVEPQIKRIFSSLTGEYKGFPIKISMGVACVDKSIQDYDTLFEMADKAAYSIKRSGKNSYRFYDDSLKDITTDRNS